MFEEIKYHISRFKYWYKNKYQKITRGYSDEELWNLDATFVRWMLPRLKAFKEKTQGYPCDVSEDEWNDILNKIIKSFEVYMKDLPDDLEELRKDTETIKEGFKLFGERLYNLWW